MIRSAAALLAFLAALPAAAQIYNWKDKDGRAVYSDLPPPSGEVKVLQPGRTPPPAVPANGAAPPSAGTASDTAKPKSVADRDLEFRQRRTAEAETQAKAEKEAATETERERFCQQARSQLSALQSGQRVARPNAAGEREFLDDAARAQEAARLQQQIDQHCP
ncbi:DUF4124 domain-containing protein [Thauera sinica]|uniref:DUF4124 domain-containing protein n=1 Tax=Thauera sinica TaxID=2665146 RepID=A0ABW1AW02_9RHOO|nr:DUF4124 domain-containing protein [Thauera sp. K11]ATE60406.1 DUF4124 domain-containing protein [Thauera sp. K11]